MESPDLFISACEEGSHMPSPSLFISAGVLSSEVLLLTCYGIFICYLMSFRMSLVLAQAVITNTTDLVA